MFKKFSDQYPQYIKFNEKTLPGNLLKMVNKADLGKHAYMLKPFDQGVEKIVYGRNNLVKIHTFGIAEQIDQLVVEILKKFENKNTQSLLEGYFKSLSAKACQSNPALKRLKKIQFDGSKNKSGSYSRDACVAQAGDVWWYVIALSKTCEIPMDFVIVENFSYGLPNDITSWRVFLDGLKHDATLLASILKRASCQSESIKFIKLLKSKYPENPDKDVGLILHRLTLRLQLCCIAHGITLSEILQKNMAKIKNRYNIKF